ncbi:MAG: chemotaxis protein CheW, partial [Rickettsiales bacterium]
VTMRLGSQLFGISVLAVQDVMRHQHIAPIPLTQKVIAGSLNVRGRIVTAYDMRVRLGLETYPQPDKIMMVVVDYRHELFALMVDAVGDVLSLAMSRFEKVPANMDPNWRTVAAGVFKLDKELLVILDVANVINFAGKDAA